MTRPIRLLAAAPLAAVALALGGCVVTPDVLEPPAPCSAIAVHPLAQCSQALEIDPVVGDPFVLTTDTCGDDATADEIDALASEWRASAAFPVAP